MRTTQLSRTFVSAIFAYHTLATAQDLRERKSFGVSSTYAPTSSHIIIGQSEQRRVWTIGVDLTRTVFAYPHFRFDYKVTLSPFFLERDPTETGEKAVLPDGTTIIFPTSTVRVTRVRGIIGYLGGYGGPPLPVYPVSRGTEETYATAISPIGAIVSFGSTRKLRPTFSTDGGLVLSSRDLPISNATRLNFLYSFGPGLEFSLRSGRTVRVEYLYRHMSNAYIGVNNPGVDAGVFRVTLSRYRR